MDGIELSVRFSYIVNSLNYCGPKEGKEKFLKYINRKENAKGVRSSLKRFEALIPYLDMIAEKSKRDIFDHDVVEAYWLGNRLLENLDDEDLKAIISRLVARGLPNSMGERLKDNLPKGMAAHHNFHVFYVGVGNTSGKVPTNIDNMNDCMISYGKVVSIKDKILEVERSPVEFREGIYCFGKKQTIKAAYMKELLPDVKPRDTVALHWNFAALILTEEQKNNLHHYTKRIIDSLNNQI